MTKELTDAEFENEVLKSAIAYLVDFWAPWCAPCTMMSATVDAIEEKYNDQINVGKINVDENPDTVERYNIHGIPTLLFFVNGKVTEKFVGLVPKADIERTIEVHL
jgi:thioredoxin 1